MNAASRWGLNYPVKTAADDSSPLRSSEAKFVRCLVNITQKNNFLGFSFAHYRQLKMSKKQIYYSDKYNDEEFEYRYDKRSWSPCFQKSGNVSLNYRLVRLATWLIITSASVVNFSLIQSIYVS